MNFKCLGKKQIFKKSPNILNSLEIKNTYKAQKYQPKVSDVYQAVYKI